MFSSLVTVFVGILYSSIREMDVPYVLDWEHGTPLHAVQGNRASSCGKGEVSCVFSSFGRHLGYRTRVCSVKSGLLSSFDRYLRNLNYSWQDNMDASSGEAGSQASLISWQRYIGIPINFHEESGIISF